MHTTIIDPFRPSVPCLGKLFRARDMSSSQWICTYGSGTLEKHERFNSNVRSLYLHERVTFEFGAEFQCIPSSRILFGTLMAEGDCSAHTELAWYAQRIIVRNPFPNDIYEVKYIHWTMDDLGTVKEGGGIVLKQSDAPWIPANHLVFAIVSEYVKGKGWQEARNPC